jgi:hypothetical protein
VADRDHPAVEGQRVGRMQAGQELEDGPDQLGQDGQEERPEERQGRRLRRRQPGQDGAAEGLAGGPSGRDQLGGQAGGGGVLVGGHGSNSAD